jgi:Anti-sigma-28 factor, FlgM
MHRHGSSCLKGPVTLDRPWWVRPSRKPRPRSKANGTEVRSDLVARVRRAIAAGTYDTPERWDAALDRLARKLQI